MRAPERGQGSGRDRATLLYGASGGSGGCPPELLPKRHLDSLAPAPAVAAASVSRRRRRAATSRRSQRREAHSRRRSLDFRSHRVHVLPVRLLKTVYIYSRMKGVYWHEARVCWHMKGVNWHEEGGYWHKWEVSPRRRVGRWRRSCRSRWVSPPEGSSAYWCLLWASDGVVAVASGGRLADGSEGAVRHGSSSSGVIRGEGNLRDDLSGERSWRRQREARDICESLYLESCIFENDCVGDLEILRGGARELSY